VTAPPEAAPLDEHLRDLSERLRRGRAQAPPVARVWLAKDDGQPRPLGKPTGEEQSVQRAGVMRWEAIDAHDCGARSSGLRQGRRPQDALHEGRARGMTEGSGGIVAADVRGDVASRDTTRRRAILRQRGKDGRRRRLSGQGLHAGGREEGVLTHPETGVPQGGTGSPVFAHRGFQHVREEWCEPEGRPRMQGRGVLSRVADDCGIGCAKEADARKLRDVLPTRVARCGWTLPPTKTARRAFRTPDAHGASTVEHGTVAVLGLTHSWAQSRRGVGGSKRPTARQRRRRTKESLWPWCRPPRHPPRPYPYQMLCLKRRGHVRYDGSRGHCRLREAVRKTAEKAWHYWVSRRRTTRAIKGEKCERLLETSVLPPPKIIHNISRVLQGSTK
jgi:RNA-directed DNA polymerase